MINLPVGKLAAAAMTIASFNQMLTFSLQHGGAKLILWDDICGDDGIVKLSEAFDDVIAAAETLQMPVTLRYAKGLKRQFAAIARFEGDEATILDSVLANTLDEATTSMRFALQAESESRVAIVLQMDKLSLYEPSEPLFGAEVAEKFKSATYDINEAAKCLALARSTASVFHLMRVAELGLRAMHACIGLAAPLNPSWGIWLAQIREERVRRGDRRWPENDYFQDLYSRLDAIKDAQRDPTMHVQTIHTETEAALIFENTKQLMKKIAMRMDETGQPYA